MSGKSRENRPITNRPFDKAELRTQQRDREKLEKTFIRKQIDFKKPMSVDLKTGMFEAIASKEIKDRENDIVELSNILIRSNLPLLYAHDQYNAYNVIGKVIEVKVEGDELHFKGQFDMNDKSGYAPEIARKVSEGIITGISIGFIPQSWDDIEIKYDGNHDFVERRIKKIELLEISVCAVAMNPAGQIKSTDNPKPRPKHKSLLSIITTAIASDKKLSPEQLVKHKAINQAHKAYIEKQENNNVNAKEFLAELQHEKEVNEFLKSIKKS